MSGNLYRRIYYGINHRLRTFAGGRWANHCRPTSIYLLLTQLCNARCVHCDIWKNRGRDDSPAPDQWKTLLTDLRSWLGPVEVGLTGGEALLKPFAPELVAHASTIGLNAEVLTHGYWDDQSKIEKLALARPWRVTVSVDGLGETHTKIRGRQGFFEKTERTLDTLRRVRREQDLKFVIRLKTVIMQHNLDDVCRVAEYAKKGGMESFFQPIEQNYNTPEDPRWFEHSANWPRSTAKAIAVVRQLIELKKQGLPIANSFGQLEVMVPYFEDPNALRVATQSHSAHEHRAMCGALTSLQISSNGDVLSCSQMAPIGNFKRTPIRPIWENRPDWWQGGCCMERRCTEAEKELLQIAEAPDEPVYHV